MVRGGDDRLWWKYWIAGEGWSDGFQNLGGTASSAPGIASWGKGRLDVFYRGSSNDLQHQWYRQGSWDGPDSLTAV